MGFCDCAPLSGMLWQFPEGKTDQTSFLTNRIGRNIILTDIITHYKQKEKEKIAQKTSEKLQNITKLLVDFHENRRSSEQGRQRKRALPFRQYPDLICISA